MVSIMLEYIGYFRPTLAPTSDVRLDARLDDLTSWSAIAADIRQSSENVSSRQASRGHYTASARVDQCRQAV